MSPLVKFALDVAAFLFIAAAALFAFTLGWSVYFH